MERPDLSNPKHQLTMKKTAKVVTSRNSPVNPEPDIERIKKRLSYDPETGIFLWRDAPRRQNGKGTAGCICKRTGYVLIRIDKALYKAHRLAWLIVHGKMPRKHLDHINCDPSDNRISNLREVTDLGNNRNKRISKQNRSGIKGVSWSNRDKKWVAQIQIDGKNVFFKLFSDINLARNAIAAAREELHGEFANHG